MSIVYTAEAVTIWLDTLGAPSRMVWAGQRYRVSDTPTRLGPEAHEFLSPEITHPPRPLNGWRFQGTTDGGDSHIFDVRRAGPDAWELFRVID